MKLYLRIFKDCSEFFFKSKQSILGLQQPIEVIEVFNTPCKVYVVCNFLEICRLKINS